MRIPAIVRSTAERWSRNSSFMARLPQQFGRRPIYLSAANHLAVLKPGEAKFEEYLLGFATRFVDPGSIAWDIGANMGMFTFPAAHIAASVIAFEPDPFNLLLLQRSAAANPDLDVTIIPAAVAEEVGTGRLQIPERGRSANALEGGASGSQMGGVRETMTVMTVSLDWMLERFPAPHFIKCDAEGAEVWILQGATELLAKARPVINMEMPCENAATCADIYRRNDYVVFDARAAIDPAKPLAKLDAWETLAIPREKIEQFAGR